MKKIAHLIIFVLTISVISAQNESPAPEEKEGKWGINPQDGYQGVPFIYDALYTCYNSKGQYIAQKNKKWGSIDANHKIIFPIEYDTKDEWGSTFNMDGAAYFELTDLFLLGKNGKWGLLDYTGKAIMAFQYDDLHSIGDAYLAKKNGKYGIINHENRIISPFQYKKFLGFWRQDMAVLSKDNKKWLFVDAQGTESTDISSTLSAIDTTNGAHLMVATQNDKQGLLNARGEIIVPCLYDELHTHFNQQLIRYRKGINYGIMTFAGKEITPPIYTKIYEYPEGNSVKVQKDTHWGLIDFAGKEIVPCLYEDIECFYAGQDITKVTQKGKIAVINRQNKLLTDFVYTEIYMYVVGLKGVERDGKWGYIDEAGKEVIPCQFESTIGFFGAKFIPVKKNGKYGYINTKGENITPFKYDKANAFQANGTAEIELNGKKGFIDQAGKENW